ncbi:MAG: PD40 domain-containing protein [Myxococcales bacterium]|nr:PD40 domain-containing protein [Myxococcales bacterium]
MLLLTPLLTAGYPTSTPTAPTPPHETTLLDGLTFPESDWDDTWAYPLKDGPNVGSTSDADINATVESCCDSSESVGPDCSAMSGSCSGGDLQFQLRGWEDSGSVTFDGTGLCYAYSQHDITRLVTCVQPCIATCVGGGGSQSECGDECAIYCGPERMGPACDNESEEFDLYEASIDSTVWKDAGVNRTATPDTTSAETGPSTTHDGSTLAFARIVGAPNLHKDLYLSTLTGMPAVWDTPAAVSDVNTPCNEDNPHVVIDELSGNDGLRLYFDSDRDPGKTSWTSTSDCSPGESHLWVARRDHTDTWGDEVLVDLPTPDTDEAWAIDSRRSPFVTANDPTSAGRQIFWSGREDDCATAGNPALGCIYRAEQSGDGAIDDPWTNQTLIVKPTAYADATYGDVIYVDHVSITGDGEYMHFSYITPQQAPPDIEPPIDTNKPLDDATKGIQFSGENWGQAYALAHPANFHDSNQLTPGWEDSVNISPDGRTLYFAYTTFVFGQAFWGQGGIDACDPDTPRVLPSFLDKGPARGASIWEKGAFDIYEATISTTLYPLFPTTWVPVYRDVNYPLWEGTKINPYSDEYPRLDGSNINDFCMNDFESEVISTSDPDCVTVDDQHQNEAAVTVSIDANGDEHMLFVRYGHLGDTPTTDPSCANAPPLSMFTFRIMESVNDWIGMLTPFTIQSDSDPCSDNDPTLTANATSVYFCSNRDAASGDCERFLAKDWRIYHSRKHCGSGSDEWCTPPDEVLSDTGGGPNETYDDCGITGCEDCPNPDPAICPPATCLPFCQNSRLPKWSAKQPFVDEAESYMYFLGSGEDCDASCIYRSERVGTSDPPTFGAPLKIAESRQIPLVCSGSSGDVDKIVGLGEPSVTRDGQFMYFVYLQLTAIGDAIEDCTANSASPDPGPEGEPWPCRCNSSYSPTGCKLPPCQLPYLFNNDPPDPGVNCTWACDPERKEFIDYYGECRPFSELLCASPGTYDGVDQYDFGIGVARRPSWQVNLGVVRAN